MAGKVFAYGYSKGHVLYRTEDGTEFRVPAKKIYEVKPVDNASKFEDYIPTVYHGPFALAE